MLALRERRRSARDDREPAKRSGVRDIAVSLMVTLLVATAIVGSLPDSSIKDVAAPVLAPLMRVTGLDQSWGVFSPNPPRRLTEVEVHVIMTNGEDRVWRLDADRSLPGYRWRKLKEEVIRHKTLRPGLAKYVVREVTGPGERAARVLMIVQTETLPLPGEGEPKKVRRLLFDSAGPSRTRTTQERAE
ncbi:hypothetical protein E4P42_09495 [Mycobacterium sp. PS03-16]|uniref:hypothetical protein n=1 Tax=Mycobacterium sp. PS03-16 TaxID=2559611 RepID=UPI0010737E23|nr:hypothetical protein [Mycobacterium sp. PS03-16]TFV59174.1 hypothetical protein E4P42_09495 [Mycobacterium sp. PS03-16]